MPRGWDVVPAPDRPMPNTFGDVSATASTQTTSRMLNPSNEPQGSWQEKTVSPQKSKRRKMRQRGHRKHEEQQIKEQIFTLEHGEAYENAFPALVAPESPPEELPEAGIQHRCASPGPKRSGNGMYLEVESESEHEGRALSHVPDIWAEAVRRAMSPAIRRSASREALNKLNELATRRAESHRSSPSTNYLSPNAMNVENMVQGAVTPPMEQPETQHRPSLGVASVGSWTNATLNSQAQRPLLQNQSNCVHETSGRGDRHLDSPGPDVKQSRDHGGETPFRPVQFDRPSAQTPDILVTRYSPPSPPHTPAANQASPMSGEAPAISVGKAQEHIKSPSRFDPTAADFSPALLNEHVEQLMTFQERTWREYINIGANSCGKCDGTFVEAENSNWYCDNCHARRQYLPVPEEELRAEQFSKILDPRLNTFVEVPSTYFQSPSYRIPVHMQLSSRTVVSKIAKQTRHRRHGSRGPGVVMGPIAPTGIAWNAYGHAQSPMQPM